jgi:DNA-directed RNA polymerase subunit RPC12/RpoP
MDEQLVQRLMTSLKCRRCGSRYGNCDIQVLGQREKMWLLSVHCPHCQKKGLLAVSLKPGPSRRPVTDLSPREVDHHAQLPPISPDEVLDLHLFLRSFHGDFSSTFPGDSTA